MPPNFPPSVTNTPLSIEKLQEVLAAEKLSLPENNTVLAEITRLQGMARIEVDKTIPGILFFVPPHTGDRRGKWVARLRLNESGLGDLDISHCVLDISPSFKSFLVSIK